MNDKSRYLPGLMPLPQKLKITGGENADTAKAEVSFKKSGAIPREGYRLEFDGRNITIEYSDESGRAYAEAAAAALKRAKSAPALIIEDEPEYEYRGFSLDCARHSFKIDEIKRLIDAAAMYRLNRFHWHLTDDQGWRIEMKGLPKLNETGSSRKRSDFGGAVDEREYRALFTRGEIRDIIQYCADRHIEVIPEIDMPGHMSAAIASYPELSCTGEKIDVVTRQGVFKNTLCVSSEKTYEFVFKALDEVCELFPGEYIHIGGDETPTAHWESCPDCRRLKEELGLKDFRALQGVFCRRVEEYLASKGKKAIMWNESLYAGAPAKRTTVIQRWMEKGGVCADFASRGGRIIESDFFHYYCDYPFGMTPVKKTYSFDPKRLYKKSAAAAPYGIEAEMWTEYIDNFELLCYRYFPRLAAAAETAWGTRTDYADFKRRFAQQLGALEALGIRPAPQGDWDVPALRRVPDILKFFSGTIKQALRPARRQPK